VLRHRRKLLVGAVVTLAVTGLTGAAPALGLPPAVAANGPGYTVTLLTGDVVTVSTGAGRCPQVSVRPVRSHRVLSKSCGPDGHVRVVPAEVAGLVGGTVDPALFDVTALIQQGYDDARTAELPLIVKPAGTHAMALGHQRSLAGAGFVAGRQSKKQPLALASVGQVWLDRRIRPTAVTEAPAADLVQVGAPPAWQAGVTGKGVRVAVLDTGIDANHPDLAGRIGASANFSDSTDTVDRVGHGTHVAATIAGTGAASHGVHSGVAPDATLLIGKVLGDDGFGTESQAIAGMEWAAPQASVVNMSFGADFSDGTDPMSQAVDALTARYGTLFVAAAGNSGPGSSTVGSPGSAASALTVGAVDGADRLADFSSRGPLLGTHAVKPEISAPGVDIVSARAAGTALGDLIDANYTRLSGTSMATPHVAGAAALVRQRHPDWTADRLKAALIGAASPATGGDLYERGAGRVTIPPALSTVVSGTSVASLGVLRFPQSGTAKAAVSWTNTGTGASTLKLGLSVTDRSGKPAPARLSAATVTVPPGGTGSVTVTVDAAGLSGRPDEYEGLLTATEGDTVVRTPVAFFVEPPSYDLTIHPTALPGTPSGAMAWDVFVTNLDDPSRYEQFFGGTQDLTVRVPAGHYSVLGEVFDTTPEAPRDALTGTAEVNVGAATTVVLDGARAKPVTARVVGVDTRPQQVGIVALQGARVGGPFLWLEPFAFDDVAGWPIYSTPIRGVDIGFLHTTEVFSLRSTSPGPSPFMYELFRDLSGSVPADPSYVVGRAEQAGLARVDERFNRLDIPGTHTGHNRKGMQQDGFFVFENDTQEVPTTRVDYLTPGVPWVEEPVLEGDSELAGILLMTMPLHTFQPGERQSITSFRQPLRPDWYDDPAGPVGCSPAPIRRTRGNLHVELAALVDEHQRFNCLSFFTSGGPLTLFRDGRQVGSVDGYTADFAIPAQTGTYRLVLDQDNSQLVPFSTRTTTAWTFRSTGPRDDSAVPVPLFSLDYALPLDSDNHPGAGTATFVVRQSNGVPTQQVTSLAVWTSVDDGATWQPATVRRANAGGFTAQLPALASGESMSLRVAATGSGGSGIDQTIIRAYRAP
jgi:subtilisin family serine protease